MAYVLIVAVHVQALKYVSAAPRTGIHALVIINARRVSAGHDASEASRPGRDAQSIMIALMQAALQGSLSGLRALSMQTAIPVQARALQANLSGLRALPTRTVT